MGRLGSIHLFSFNFFTLCRSRQQWFGNVDPESQGVVHTSVAHVWPGVRKPFFILFYFHVQSTSLDMWRRMRSSLVVRASDCQCTSCNGPGFDPSIRRHSGIWGAADEAVLNIVRKKNKKNPPKKILLKKRYVKAFWKQRVTYQSGN